MKGLCRLRPSLEQKGRRTVTHCYPPNRGSVDYSRSDGMANGSGKLVEADDMKSRLNDTHEKHVDYGPSAGFRIPILDKDLPPGERHETVSGHRAEAESVAPYKKYDVPPQDDKKSGSDEYNVQKARLHANLWRQEIKKHSGEGISIEADADSEFRQSSGWNPRKSMPEDWEVLDPSEGHYYDESPAKEEAMMFEEFEKRRERNRIQIASFVKQHLFGRRRPVDGWKYILNNFGKDGKGAGGSALSVEGQTTGNDLEKLALKSESSRLRRKA